MLQTFSNGGGGEHQTHFSAILSSNAVMLLKSDGNQHICRTPNNTFVVWEAAIVL